MRGRTTATAPKRPPSAATAADWRPGRIVVRTDRGPAHAGAGDEPAAVAQLGPRDGPAGARGSCAAGRRRARAVSGWFASRLPSAASTRAGRGTRSVRRRTASSARRPGRRSDGSQTTRARLADALDRIRDRAALHAEQPRAHDHRDADDARARRPRAADLDPLHGRRTARLGVALAEAGERLLLARARRRQPPRLAQVAARPGRGEALRDRGGRILRAVARAHEGVGTRRPPPAAATTSRIGPSGSRRRRRRWTGCSQRTPPAP